VNSVFDSNYIAPTITTSPILSPTPTILPFPTLTPTPTNEDLWHKYKSNAGQNKTKLKESINSNNELFHVRDVVKLKNNLVVEFLGTNHQIQPYYPNPGETFVVDIGILNLSSEQKSQYIDFSNFELKDDKGYTYKPYVLYNGKGDVTGEIKREEYKRGEICFVVPLGEVEFIDNRPVIKNSPKYTLIFKTRDESIVFDLYKE
jgi:hypothetical protein